MKLNKNTRIIGKNVVLVPYMEKHVLRYHEWMKSPELLHFTASEPLSLEQEYQMQKQWLEDEDKCTFIILEKKLYESTKSETSSMIGDTNLFFNDINESTAAEAEIMIAESEIRGKNRGTESMILMLRYDFFRYRKLKRNKIQGKNIS
ncbi:N-acetyltransferase 9-like protein isoform X2 [Prorops nasuta]|uniref:N-acetyltransferase 9-like protein isoform X2 n=1 Tax=Prorops nasuta TaxID=863751 RepID=UPI0034CF10A6